MMRTKLAALALLLASWAGSVHHGQATAQRRRPPHPSDAPNILFILTDDHRWDALGCYGNDSLRTPNLNRLAKDGVRFDSFYVACPTCGPSRAAILSGLAPHQTGVLNNEDAPEDLPDDLPTIATHLNGAGYVTGLVGKVHLLGDPARHDFQEYPVYLPGGWCSWQNPVLVVDGVSQQVIGQSTQIFAEAALDFIERHVDERWFLWFAPTAPHPPHFYDANFPYVREELVPPPGWPASQPFNSEPFPKYYSTISHLDNQVGRVLDRLDQLGLSQNTLVIMMGDNGDMLGSHGYQGKQIWFEESARVSALARWPGHIRPGTTVESPVVSTDIFATLLEVSGVAKPAGYECVSMLPAMTGRPPLRKTAYSEVRQTNFREGHWQMIRHGPWKYVTFLDRPEEHLYDIAGDPHELEDLVSSREHVAVLDAMRQRHAAWLAATP